MQKLETYQKVNLALVSIGEGTVSEVLAELKRMAAKDEGFCPVPSMDSVRKTLESEAKKDEVVCKEEVHSDEVERIVSLLRRGRR